MRTGAWTDDSGEQVVQSGDMVHTEQPSFDASEEAVLDEIGRYLRAEGWQGVGNTSDGRVAVTKLAENLRESGSLQSNDRRLNERPYCARCS